MSRLDDKTNQILNDAMTTVALSGDPAVLKVHLGITIEENGEKRHVSEDVRIIIIRERMKEERPTHAPFGMHGEDGK